MKLTTTTRLPKTADDRTAFGCMIAMAVPFVLGGLVFGMTLVDSIVTWARMRQLVETPATILESKLETEFDDEGTALFKVRAKYEYTFAGERHESTRATIEEGADNLPYHQEKAKLLKAAQSAGQKFPCYVNPNKPAEAVLFRELRLGMLGIKLLGTLIFGGVGLGLIAAATHGRRTEKRKERVKQEAPDRPWAWRPDWKAGRIRSSGDAVPWFLLGGALFWNSVCWPMYFVVQSRDAADQDAPKWLFGLFPTLGVVLGMIAAYLWLQRLWWGRSVLELGSIPGVIGGKLVGVIHAPRKVRADDGVTLELSCRRQVTKTSGSETEVSEDAIWSKERRVARDLAAGANDRTIIPVEFVIPFDGLQTDDKIRWQLLATAVTRGFDYSAQFDVPVYRTAESRRDGVKESGEADAEKETTAPAPGDLNALATRMGAVLERDAASGQRILFPGTRNRNMCMYTAWFTAMWTAATVAAFKLGAPGFLSWTFAFFAALTGIMLLVWLFARTRLEFGPARVISDTRLFGIGWRTSLLPGEIKSIGVKKSGSTYGATTFREIFANVGEGKTHTLVSEIPRLDDAEQLAKAIRKELAVAKKQATAEPAKMTLEAELPEDLRE